MNVEDPHQLLAYLVHHGYVPSDPRPAIRILTGGVSSATVHVRLPDGRAWVLKKALPKLRTKIDWYSPVTRIHREAAGMRALAEILPPGAVPELVFEDHANHVIAMEAVPEPHENFKDVLMAGRVDDAHVRQFADLLAAIHRAGLDRWPRLLEDFKDRTFFESLRLEPYYQYAAHQVPRAEPFVNALVADTLDRRVSLVHGDYSPKNVLIHAGRLVLLDHEVMHFGDPAFDIGFALAHLLSKAHHWPARRELFRAAAVTFWQTYRASLTAGAGQAQFHLTNRRLRDAHPAEDVAAYEARCARHALACLLARVAGRSRLEYLSEDERARQQRAAVALMEAGAPPTIAGLVQEFVGAIQ